MNGYTPWELAVLKRRYHGYDASRKGYLDHDDVAALCSRAGLTEDPAVAARLFHEIDRDSDHELTFDELTRYLAFTPTEEAARLRSHFLATEASAAAGATMGLLTLFKAKAAVGIGAFFADPIRLFRDYYVEYTTSVRTHERAGLKGGFLAAMRKVGVLSGSGWLLFSVALDSGVGAAMFLTYAYARAAYADAWQRMNPRLPKSLRNAPPGTEVSTVFDHSQQLVLEGAAGFTAGTLSGVLEAPAQAIASSHLRPSAIMPAMRRHTFKWHWRVTRAAFSHAAFFSSFYGARVGVGSIAYDVCGFRHSSFNGAIVTALSGCLAGAGYRLFAVPIDNYSALVRTGTARTAFHAQPAAVRRAVLTKGLASSLAFTMPVTGFVFLGYEYALMYL